MTLAKVFQDAQPIGAGLTPIWVVLTAVGSAGSGAAERPTPASPATARHRTAH